MFKHVFPKVYVIGSLSLLAACHSSSNPQNNSDQVLVSPPITKVAPYKLHYIGITKAFRKVDIRARVDGILKERYFKDGDLVKNDELLYLIEEEPYQAQVLSAQGQVDKATADVAFQEIQYKRYQDLVAKKSISKSEFDQQFASYLSAKGQLENAQGNLDQAQINLSYCRIHSPLTGIAGKNQVDPGNLMKSSDKTYLLTIVQVTPMRVEFNAVASDLSYYTKYAQYKPFPVEITIPKDSSRVWKSTLDFYNNEINQSTSTILLRTTVDNPDFTLRPELYLDVLVTVDPKHHFTLVPAYLVKEVQGLFQIRVVDKSSHIQVRMIKTGRVDGENLEVESGLETGDMVLMDNLTLPAGTLVKPVITKKSG